MEAGAFMVVLLVVVESAMDSVPVSPGTFMELCEVVIVAVYAFVGDAIVGMNVVGFILVFVLIFRFDIVVGLTVVELF